VDIVLFKGTMHNVEKPLGAISEAKRVCRRDGRIIIVDFVLFPIRWLRWRNLKWRLHPGKLWAKPPDKHPGFSEREIRAYVRGLNMTLEKYEPNFAPGHHSGHSVPVFLAVAKKVDSAAG
jgi:SAM-dependent methyltransferase